MPRHPSQVPNGLQLVPLKHCAAGEVGDKDIPAVCGVRPHGLQNPRLGHPLARSQPTQHPERPRTHQGKTWVWQGCRSGWVSSARPGGTSIQQQPYWLPLQDCRFPSLLSTPCPSQQQLLRKVQKVKLRQVSIQSQSQPQQDTVVCLEDRTSRKDETG